MGRAVCGRALAGFLFMWSITGALGCGGGDSGGDPGGSDAAPAACVTSPAPDGWQYPSGPYGVEPGETLADIALEDCDGEPVSLGEVLGDAELMLVSIGAGWCEPCVTESETLEAEIYSPYCERGLRAVQILFQDTDSQPATRDFCRQWRERFGLSFPVLIDPLFESERYFDDVAGQTPINFLITRDGEIVYKATGTPAADLPDRIDALLPR
ncbi:MAG: hypothetical protein Tsb0020_38870 [Haliangiales bacterium]